MIVSLFTLSMSAGALYLILKFQNMRWRILATAYASATQRPAKSGKRLATVVAYGGDKPFFTTYAGVWVTVCEDGLGLRLILPFSAGAPPLFLPYDEMTVRRRDWFLNSGSFSIRMERGFDVELIIDDDLYSWIQANTDRCELEI